MARALAAPGAAASLDAAVNAEMGVLIARCCARCGASADGAPAAAELDLLPELQRMSLRTMFRFLTVR